jgi:hypothetical protein
MFIVGLLMVGKLLALGPEIRWTRVYGGSERDEGRFIRSTSDGGFIIGGQTRSYGLGSTSIYLIKTDENGDTLWTRVFGGSIVDYCHEVYETFDGGYIVSTSTTSFGPGGFDLYLIKTDDQGDTIWTSIFGGVDHDKGLSVCQTFDGGYIIAGYTHSYGAGQSDVYVVRTDSNGDSLWTRTFGGAGYERGYSVAQTPDSGYIVAGWTESFGAGGSDVYVIRLSENGDSLWTRTYGGSGSDYCYSAILTDDGFVLGGKTNSFGSVSDDIYIIRADVDGDTIWTRAIGGATSDFARSVVMTVSGKYVLLGQTGSYPEDFYMVAVDSEGDSIWASIFGGDQFDDGYCVDETPDSGFIITGYTSSFGTGGDVWVVRTEAPFPDWAWLSRSATGKSVAESLWVPQWDTLVLSVMLENDTGPAIAAVYPLSYDPGKVELDTMYFDTTDFPSWFTWEPYSYVSDTILNDTGRVLIYLSNGNAPEYALPERKHRIATLEFIAIEGGEFVIDTCFYPPTFHRIYYTDTLGVDYEPHWIDCKVIVHGPDIEVSPDSFSFVLQGFGPVFDMLWVENTGYIDTLDVDSILNSSDWLDVNMRDFEVLVGDTQLIVVSASGVNIAPGYHSDTLRIYSNDPDEPLIIVPVSLMKETTDVAWLSQDSLGLDVLTELHVEEGDTFELGFFLMNYSDVAHGVAFPVCYDTVLLDLLSLRIDSSTFADPSFWNFALGDTVIGDTGKMSFYAWTTTYVQGIPSGMDRERIGVAHFSALVACHEGIIDTCEYPGHGSLSYVHGTSTTTYVPEWQLVLVSTYGEMCGDCQGDCQVTTADGYWILNYFGAGPPPVSCWAANVDGDDQLTPADGFYLLNWFGAGSPLNCQPCGSSKEPIFKRE